MEIDYTLKKNLRKPNGSKPGFVVYYTNYSMMAERTSAIFRKYRTKFRIQKTFRTFLSVPLCEVFFRKNLILPSFLFRCSMVYFLVWKKDSRRDLFQPNHSEAVSSLSGQPERNITVMNKTIPEIIHRRVPTTRYEADPSEAFPPSRLPSTARTAGPTARWNLRPRQRPRS